MPKRHFRRNSLRSSAVRKPQSPNSFIIVTISRFTRPETSTITAFWRCPELCFPTYHNGTATDYRSRRSTYSDSAGWPGCSRKSLSVCSEKDDRKVMISVLTQSLSVCETELWVPLDGGSTYTTRITPLMDPNTIYFYSTVPSTPTTSAVLDIRFECEPSYPEGFNPQTTSAFMIAGAGSQ